MAALDLVVGLAESQGGVLTIAEGSGDGQVFSLVLMAAHEERSRGEADDRQLSLMVKSRSTF